MPQMKDLFIGLLIAGTLLTSLANLINAGVELTGTSFSENFAGLNKSLEVYSDIENTGSTLKAQETEESDLGLFSLKGAWTSLKNLLGSIDLFREFADAALSISDSPSQFYLLVAGVIGVTVIYIVLGRALGGQP